MLRNPLRARKKNQWCISKTPVPQQQQGGFRKPLWWPPAKARCESDPGLHFINGAMFVSVSLRLLARERFCHKPPAA
jgi:hypothetical protein